MTVLFPSRRHLSTGGRSRCSEDPQGGSPRRRVMGSGSRRTWPTRGSPCLMLDIVPPSLTDEERKKGSREEPRVRNRLALKGLERIRKEPPRPLYSPEGHRADLDRQLSRRPPEVSECDWIVEVVVENLKIKQALYGRFEAACVRRAPSSPRIHPAMRDRADGGGTREGVPPPFPRHPLLHPVRYMKLLELVAGGTRTPRSSPGWRGSAERALGKGIVFGRTTPNFVGNRVAYSP